MSAKKKISHKDRADRAEIELEFLKKTNFKHSFSYITSTFIKWAGMVGLASCAYLSIDSIAGKNTKTDIDVNAEVGFLENLFESTDTNWWLIAAIVVLLATSIIASLAWYAERKVRKNYMAKNARRTALLEKELDKQRTSSHLLADGGTSPEQLP